MVDIFDTLSTPTKPEIGGISSFSQKGDIFDQVIPVRPLHRRTEPIIDKPVSKQTEFRGASAGMTFPYKGKIAPTPDVENLSKRFGKHIANIPSNLARKIVSPKGLPNKLTIKALSYIINRSLKKEGIETSYKDIQQDIIKDFKKVQRKIPALEIAPPEGLGETAVDIGGNIGQFVAELAVLRKVAPVGTSDVAVWEMQNLMAGGTPGSGAAMYGAFSAPGKIIKGTTLAAKAGRIGAESASLATLSAVEQMVDTGEIDPVQIGIAAGIPVALRTSSAIKTLIKNKHPKVINAVAATHPELLERLAPAREVATRLKLKVPEPIDMKSTNKVVQSWSKKAKLLNRTERKLAVKKLRKAQAARGKATYKREREMGTSRVEAFRKAKKAYAGKAAVPEIEPLKLTPEQRDFYDRRIESVYPEERIFQRTGTATALDKMQQGRIPTNYEFGLLEPVLGREATKNLFTELIKKRPFSGWEIPALTIQAFKTKFGLDIQMFRQGRSLALRHPTKFLNASWINARAYVDNKYAEKLFNKVKISKGFTHSEKVGYNYVGEAGYSSKRLEYYSLGLTERLLVSKYKPLRAWGRLLEASERGAVAGINSMQKSLYDQSMKQVRKLNLTPAQQELWLKNRAKTHNTFMKILRVPPGEKYKGLRKLKEVANYMLFSPSMTASRPLQIKALIANKGSRKYTAEVISSNIASIFAITSIPALMGHQQRLQNPSEEPDVNGELNILDSNWGKIRWHNTIFDFSGGDAPFYRTLARIGVSTYMRTKATTTGKEVTEFAGRKIPSTGETLKRYMETRETAALGYAQTMLSGKDWMGRPIPRHEATIRALSPELIEAVVDAGMADGLWESIAAFAGATTSVGVSTYPERATATRAKFRDIVAKQNYNKDWDTLSISQQNKLRATHRQQFDILAERIRKEQKGKAISIEKIKEEEVKAGKRIESMLSKENQALVEDISLGISRRPKKWYLNDTRYNRYLNIIAANVDDRLSKINFSRMDDKQRRKRIEVIVNNAKNRAYATLRKEVQSGR